MQMKPLKRIAQKKEIHIKFSRNVTHMEPLKHIVQKTKTSDRIFNNLALAT
jgi:hypothetical protein